MWNSRGHLQYPTDRLSLNYELIKENENEIAKILGLEEFEEEEESSVQQSIQEETVIIPKNYDSSVKSVYYSCLRNLNQIIDNEFEKVRDPTYFQTMNSWDTLYWTLIEWCEETDMWLDVEFSNNEVLSLNGGPEENNRYLKGSNQWNELRDLSKLIRTITNTLAEDGESFKVANDHVGTIITSTLVSWKDQSYKKIIERLEDILRYLFNRIEVTETTFSELIHNMNETSKNYHGQILSRITFSHPRLYREVPFDFKESIEDSYMDCNHPSLYPYINDTISYDDMRSYASYPINNLRTRLMDHKNLLKPLFMKIPDDVSCSDLEKITKDNNNTIPKSNLMIIRQKDRMTKDKYDKLINEGRIYLRLNEGQTIYDNTFSEYKDKSTKKLKTEYTGPDLRPKRNIREEILTFIEDSNITKEQGENEVKLSGLRKTVRDDLNYLRHHDKKDLTIRIPLLDKNDLIPVKKRNDESEPNIKTDVNVELPLRIEVNNIVMNDNYNNTSNDITPTVEMNKECVIKSSKSSSPGSSSEDGLANGFKITYHNATIEQPDLSTRAIDMKSVGQSKANAGSMHSNSKGEQLGNSVISKLKAISGLKKPKLASESSIEKRIPKTVMSQVTSESKLKEPRKKPVRKVTFPDANKNDDKMAHGR